MPGLVPRAIACDFWHGACALSPLKEGERERRHGACPAKTRNEGGLHMMARLLAATALASAMLLPHAAYSQASDKIVRIGVLTDMNGPASDATGSGSLAAA